MNDARESQESIRLEWERDQETFKRMAQEGRTSRRSRGVLTAESAAARQAWLKEQQSGELALPVTEKRPEPPPAPIDASAPLRHMRLGIAAVVVLVVFLLWVRQRRRA